MVRTRIPLGQRIRIGNPDPDPGRPKWPPKMENNEEMWCWKSLNVRCRGLQRHTDKLIKKKCSIIHFKHFVIINFGLDPDQDWIRIQQQAVSGFGMDSAKYLDPDPDKDSLNMVPKHCLQHYITLFQLKFSTYLTVPYVHSLDSDKKNMRVLANWCSRPLYVLDMNSKELRRLVNNLRYFRLF